MLNIKQVHFILLLVATSSMHADNTGTLTVRVAQTDFSTACTAKKEFASQGLKPQVAVLTDIQDKGDTFKELPFAELKEEFGVAVKNRDVRYNPKKLQAPEAAFLDKLIAKMCAEQVGAMKEVVVSIGKILTTDYESVDAKLVDLVKSFDGFCMVVRKYKESVVPLIKESCDDATIKALEITTINPRQLLEQYAVSSEDTLTFFKRELSGNKEVQVKELGRAIKQLILDVLKSWPLSMRAWKKIQG